MKPPYRLSFLCILAMAGLLPNCAGGSNTADPGDGGGGSSGNPPREPILDGGGQIPAPPDGASLCPMGACNYQTGSGCTPDGAAASCVPLPTGTGLAPTCEKAGSAAYGQNCMQWTDCVAGAVCAGGKCRKLCCGRDWTGCPSGEHCLRSFEVQLTDGRILDSQAFLCFPVNQCSALTPETGCSSSETCQIADPTGATACLPDGTGVAGQPCPCKGGYTCVGGGCRRLCRAVSGGGEPSCPAVEGTCVHFARDPAGVGECTPI